jgi:hypothetical protein
MVRSKRLQPKLLNAAISSACFGHAAKTMASLKNNV